MSLDSAWTLLHAQIHRTLRARQLLPQQRRLLVAVSGGQDSLCLIKLLLDLQPKWGWHLGIAHCDHRWRSDSAANARYVKQIADAWLVPFYGHTAVTNLKSEAAARQWRYQALLATAKANKYEYIVTGHTASDRTETLLYNLIRGSGADGLQALTWRRELEAGVWLVRPLLEVTRSQTIQFCRDFQIVVWEDATNQDLRYARNRIRQELLPYLQTHFNPQVEQAIAQTAELLQTEVEYLELAASNLKSQATPSPSLSAQNQNQLGLNRHVLQAAPLALQRRAIRQMLQQALTSEAPGFKQVEKLTALITAPNGTRTDPFPGGAVGVVEGEWIWLRQKRAGGAGGEEII